MFRGRYLAMLLALLLFSSWGLAQAGAARHRRANAESAARPTLKGILEPVNYSADVNLTDVFFVNAETGWVSGEHATILKTTDGGAHWKAQVGGDPNGPEKPIGQLRFLDARHGWALTDDSPQRLLSTLDGENWDQIAQGLAPGSGFIDYAFTSVSHGLALGGNMGGFFITNDGGRHWQNVGPCQITVSIQGLPQTQTCYPLKLQMLSSTSGLAFTTWRSPDAPNAITLAIFRTDNGGQSWSYVVPAFHEGGNVDIFFTDLNHGVAAFDHKTYITADGGRNWRALLSGGITLDSGGPVRFADPEVGWALGHSTANRDAFRICFTNDGGQHWQNSPDVPFPGNIFSKVNFSFPRRDRAYIVGSHGMIYRYRVVPASYVAANALPAPLMPGFDTTALTAATTRISSDVQKLRAQLAAAGGTANSAAPSDTAAPPVNPATAQVPAPDAAAFGGGFVQDVDSSPPSPQLQSCCAASLQNLQSDLTSFNQVAPVMTTRYRSLNLAIAGLQLVSSLASQARSMAQTFGSLKHASSLQAATALLQQLSAALSSTQQAATTGFQDPGGWYAAGGASANAGQGGFQQDVGPGGVAQPPHP